MSLSRLCGLIVRVRVVPRRTVVGDIDRRFDNLSESHHQSLLKILLIFLKMFAEEVQRKLSADVCLYVHAVGWIKPAYVSLSVSLGLTDKET